MSFRNPTPVVFLLFSQVYLIETFIQETDSPDINFGAYFQWDNKIVITLIAVSYFSAIQFGFVAFNREFEIPAHVTICTPYL